LSVRLHATIVIECGAEVLAQCRRRVNELLAEDFDEEFRELHTEARLEYRFRVSGGIPFPAFVAASQAFPDLTVQIEWSEPTQGRTGRAVIRNGKLEEQSTSAGSATGPLRQYARAGADGGLVLAMACRAWHGAWHGYAIAAAQHAFFRVDGGERAFVLLASDGVEGEWAERWTHEGEGARYERLTPPQAIGVDEQRELDAIAREFAREWIWFAGSPPEETAVERGRYEAYGVPVAGANLRSEKLRKVLQADGDGSSFDSFGADARWIVAAVHTLWLEPDESDLSGP
jgi:hypothetical protein